MVKDQIPYATALALTRLAQGAQVAVKTQAHYAFELRNPRRIEAGIRITPARKQDFRRGDIHSEVYDIDPFMALQETGGRKTASSGSLAIPDELVHTKKRTATGSIKKAWKPTTLIRRQRDQPGRPRKWGRHRKPRPFIMHYGSSGGSIAIRAGHERYPLIYLYHFKRAAKISPRFQFIRTVDRWVAKEFGRQFAMAMQRALK